MLWQNWNRNVITGRILIMHWNLKLNQVTKFFVIAVVYASSVCDAQQLCPQALNVTVNKSFSSLPSSLQFLQEPGNLSPIIERNKETVIDGNWINRTIRQRKNFPYLFVDLLFSAEPSVFKDQIIAKIEMNRNLTECWEAGDCSEYKLRVFGRKSKITEEVERRESFKGSEGSLPVSQLTVSVVPGRMKFSKIEIRSLVKMYNEIHAKYKKADLINIINAYQDVSAEDREIATYALQSEKAFVIRFTLKSMREVGYVSGQFDEIHDHIEAYYAAEGSTPGRARAFN